MKKLIILFLGLFLFGCAAMSPKLDKPFEKNRVFNATFEEVWSAVLQTLRSDEIVNLTDKNNRIISFQKNITVDIVDKVALAPKGIAWRSATASVSIIVRKENDFVTSVTVNSKILGFGSGGLNAIFGTAATPAQQIEMGSRGIIEKEYLEKIDLLLKKNTTN